MKYLHIFETYKAQKEIENLANLCIKKLAEETYEWNKDFVWTEPKEGDFEAMIGKTYRVSFKNKSDDFTENANYLVGACNGVQIKFQGYNKVFLLDDLKLTWSEVNQYKFKQFISTSVEAATRDKMSEFSELVDFIKNTYVKYEVVKNSNSKDKGQMTTNNSSYRNMTVTIFLVENILLELSKSKRKSLGDYTSDDLYFSIYNDLISTTIHELQHAYDGYRSKGKSFNKQNSDYIERREKAYTLKSKEELEKEDRDFLNNLTDEYLNFPHEINARFSQAIKEMDFTKLIKNDDGKYIFSMHPLQEVVNSFKLYFKGYNILTTENKKRLIRKVSQFWHFEKERITQKNIQMNESVMQMAYHVTDKKNLESIFKNGLETRVPEDYGETGDTKAVYLFKTIDDAKTALSQWLGERIEDWEEETGETYEEVLLHVNITGLECLDTVEFEWTCLEDIPADRIMSVDYEI